MKTTITDKTILLSKKGMKELKKKITQLEHDKKSAMQAIRELDRTLGRDERLSRIEKLADLDTIESELVEKKSIIASAKLLPVKQTRLRVAIGSVVDLIDRHGHFFRYKIVDSVEADPSDGRISALSPLGQNLLGRTVKDIVECCSGRQSNWFQLVRIA
ncbi:MAG: GreA/GreB family elongation factor [Candidatus Saccharibacteria bacterium]